MILYALGLGVGADPLDESQLKFVYEKDLVALATLPVILGAARIRDLGLGINYLKLVHGEQSLVNHRPLPTAGTVVTRSKVVCVQDKGPDMGAVITLRRTVLDQTSGDLLATLHMLLFAIGDGGIGSHPGETVPLRAIPERPADLVWHVQTDPRAALIYRLSGDLKPLHADPAVVLKAGFKRPILHGLATYGVIAHAVLQRLCQSDPDCMKSFQGRFSAPVFPGEHVEISIWHSGTDAVHVRAVVPERGVIAFTNGFADLSLPRR